MNITEKSLSDAVRDSIHAMTPGGYRRRDNPLAWLVGMVCVFGGCIAVLFVLSMLAR